jgi:hypothetical protein
LRIHDVHQIDSTEAIPASHFSLGSGAGEHAGLLLVVAGLGLGAASPSTCVGHHGRAKRRARREHAGQAQKREPGWRNQGRKHEELRQAGAVIFGLKNLDDHIPPLGARAASATTASANKSNGAGAKGATNVVEPLEQDG